MKNTERRSVFSLRRSTYLRFRFVRAGGLGLPHRGILDALRERDAQRAKTLMREHWLTSMNGSLKDTMESLRQAKASGPDETES